MKTTKVTSNNFCSLVLVILFFGATICAAQVNPDSDNPYGAMDMIPDVGQMQQDQARLQILEPLSTEQLIAWFPEELNGLERTSVGAGKNAQPGVTMVQAIYRTPGQTEFLTTATGGDILNPNYKTVMVGVMDGAGRIGAGLVSATAMMTRMNFEQDDEKKHQKVVEVNGIKAQETYHKQKDRTEVQFVYDGRFGISVEANKFNSEETWNHIANLGLENLPK